MKISITANMYEVKLKIHLIVASECDIFYIYKKKKKSHLTQPMYSLSARTINKIISK